MLDGDLGRLRHAHGVIAEDLHGRRVLPRELLEEGEGLFVVIAQRLGGDQLRAGKARAHLGADLAESNVRHPCHGGKRQLGIDDYISNQHGDPP